MQEIEYRFVYMDKCIMCGASADNHRILGRRLNRSQGRNPKNKIGISTTVVKCNNCGLIFANPQPRPFDIQQDHYSMSPLEYWDENYVTDNAANFFSGEISILKMHLDYSPGAKALDVGAGIGNFMRTLIAERFDAHGIEPSEEFYKYAVERMKINPDKLKFSSIEDADYPENYFDFISFGAVLEHLYDPSQAIIKTLKWLRPKGIIRIEVPSSAWLVNKIINLYYNVRGTDYVGNISPMHPPYHLYEFGLKSFVEHARQNHYEIVQHTYYVCEATYMPKIVNYFIQPIMKWTNTGMQIIIWLRKY